MGIENQSLSNGTVATPDGGRAPRSASLFASTVEGVARGRIHLVGIGGIGMSALAQLLAHLGFQVSGSDRALGDPASAGIFRALTAGGIALFPQDGSFAATGSCDALVFSTAIESDNPDFLAAPDSVPIIHRADMLASAINSLDGRTSIAVAGSCGKTSVTAWLSEALANLGMDPLMVGGGISNSLASAELVGNFRPGDGAQVVFEADESDKSLLRYSPDYALILNITTDHYSKVELIDLFSDFLSRVKLGCVVSREVFEMLGAEAFGRLRVAVFDGEVGSTAMFPDFGEAYWRLDEYASGSMRFSKVWRGALGEEKFLGRSLSLPSPGRHTALNALAVIATADMLGTDCISRLEAVADFGGVWRRFERHGFNRNGAEVRDDYAHNPDKIASAIATAREIASRVFVVFQPHGFKPLEFMRSELFETLERVLSDDDEFCFLPVFYAGGTTSFSPTSEEVCEEFKKRGSKKYRFFSNREDAVLYLEMNALQGDWILVAGARDNSLSDFAAKLACKKSR